MVKPNMITIVNYGLCNVGSLSNMLRKIGQASQITNDPEIVAHAERIILPGVGSFDAGIRNLSHAGLDEAVKFAAKKRKAPLLGICLGMQLMGRGSEEGTLPGLGLVEAETRAIRRTPAFPNLTIPHMGWNAVSLIRAHPLFRGLEEATRFYFVHSYHVVCDHEEDRVGETVYGERFTSFLAHENVAAVQFHPEKSHRFGMMLLKNFAEL